MRNRNNYTIENTINVYDDGLMTPLARIDEKKPMQSRLATAHARKTGFSRKNNPSHDAHSYAMKSETRSGLSRVFNNNDNPSITSSTGLQNSARVNDISKLRKDHIKAKVAYEWKQIFKNLTRYDPSQSGKVSANQFLSACTTAGAKLSNIDMRTISKMFAPAEDSSMVDYIGMSKELQLHYSSLNFVQQRITNVESLKQIMNKSAKNEMKHLNQDELRQMISIYQTKNEDPFSKTQTAAKTEATNRSGTTLQSV